MYISGIGHAGLILWILFGGLFLADDLPPPPESTDVSLISAEDFAALTPAQDSPSAALDVALPAPPVVEETPVPVPVPQPRPVPQDPPVAQPSTDPDPAPEQPDTPEPAQTDVVEEVTPLPQPPAPEAPPVVAPPAETAQPQPAPRVAPTPVPDAPPTPDIADTVTPRVSPDADTPVQAEDLPPASPPEATTEIVTEAETPSAAPVSTARPIARPQRPAAVAAPETPAPDPVADAVASSVAETAPSSETTPPVETPRPAVVPSGPPLTGREKDTLRLAVQQCWNVGSLSTEAMQFKVEVGVSMNRDGTPVNESIRLVGSSGGNSASVNRAFETARRAIIRCGARGFDLPVEKYSQWAEIVMTFNPEGMRLR